MINRETARALLALIPEDRRPSLSPCYDANPVLWSVWCGTTGRPAHRSDVWTEYDVTESAILIIKAHINDTLHHL